MILYAYYTIFMNEFTTASSKGHRDVIDRYAEAGYRYAGFVPTKIDKYGKIVEIDLVFELEQKEEKQDE